MVTQAADHLSRVSPPPHCPTTCWYLLLQADEKAEKDRALSLPTLMKTADALNTETSVILGQQAPRRSGGQDRVMMRALFHVVHDTAAGSLPPTRTTLEELKEVTGRCWGLYWKGHYTKAGALAAPQVR